MNGNDLPKAGDVLLGVPVGEGELVQALARYRDHHLGILFAVGLELAGRSCPDEMRRALGQLLDLSALDDMARRALSIATEAQQAALEARSILHDLRREAEQLRGEIDGLRFRLDQSGKKGKAESVVCVPAM